MEHFGDTTWTSLLLAEVLGGRLQGFLLTRESGDLIPTNRTVEKEALYPLPTKNVRFQEDIPGLLMTIIRILWERQGELQSSYLSSSMVFPSSRPDFFGGGFGSLWPINNRNFLKEMLLLPISIKSIRSFQREVIVTLPAGSIRTF